MYSHLSGTKASLLPGLPVILESPAVPVTEGDNVTLRCRSQETSTSSAGATTDFYKDGILLWSSSSTNLTLHRVSEASGGLYKCNISDKGESPESWLIVRGETGIARLSKLHLEPTFLRDGHVLYSDPFSQHLISNRHGAEIFIGCASKVPHST